MRPVVRFSAVGQVNVHPLLVGGLASIWCRVRGTRGYSCLPGCLPMAFSLDTGMVTTMVTRKTAFFRVAYLALLIRPCEVSSGILDVILEVSHDALGGFSQRGHEVVGSLT